MSYPLQMFKNVDGNLVMKVAQSKEDESELKKDGFFQIGTGPFRDPAKKVNG